MMTDWELLFGDIFGITVECWWNWASGA